MPLLKSESNKHTTPTLSKAMVEVVYNRGDKRLFQQLGFKSFEGESFDVMREKALPGISSVGDPYGKTPLPNGTGSSQRVPIEVAMLARNADTPRVDVIGKSNYFDLRAQDVRRSAKKIALDFSYHFVNGDGGRLNLIGLEGWLDRDAGYYTGSAASPVYNPGVYGSFRDQRLYATTGTGEATPFGTKDSLSLYYVDDLLSRTKDPDGFSVLYSDRQTKVEFESMLNATPGNTAPMLMVPEFGQAVFGYKGVPWVVLDSVGAEKKSDFLVATLAADGDVTINATTEEGRRWIGFTMIDVQRNIEFYDAVGNLLTATEHTVTQVVSGTSIETSASGLVSANTLVNIVLPQTHAIYAVNFDEDDGVCSAFYANPGMTPDVGEFEGPIAGFSVDDIGLHQEIDAYRFRLTWYGQLLSNSPYAVASLTHFAL